MLRASPALRDGVKSGSWPAMALTSSHLCPLRAGLTDPQNYPP
jgi:hypothetical protein